MNKKRSTRKSFGSTFVLLFCVGLLAAVFTDRLSPIVTGFYSLMSLFTFISYAIDKAAAKNGRWRTSEKMLHLFSLMGGWPGAFFAQKILRHKSSKNKFKRVFWLTVLFNVVCLIWLHSEKGISLFNKII